MDDFEEMLKLYPEMILIKKLPPCWKGLITVHNSLTNCKMKVKVKLTVPSFPRLDNLIIYFGPNIAHLFGINFKNQIDLLMKRSESISCFVQELVSLIEKLMQETQSNQDSITSTQTHDIDKLLKELNYVLSEPTDVEFSATKDLSLIKLTMSDISMTVHPTDNSTGQNSWKIISSDLPELPNLNLNEKKLLTLKEIRNMFQKQVDALEEVWEQLRKIDNFCWVTDPINPKPYHLYRRIYLSSNLSLLLTLNPVDPTGYPKIQFLGTKSEVEKYRDMIQEEDAIENWDLEYAVYENLLTLLHIDEFPQAPETKKSAIDEGMVGDDECCICFSTELENGELSDEICNNLKCRRNFHSSCLFQWLQELATNKIVFNKIFGSCPNCGEEVSCNVPSS